MFLYNAVELAKELFRMAKFIALFLLLLLLPCCASADVPPVDGLPDNFLFGADVSTVLAEENSGVVYRDSDGNPCDLFVLLKQSGWTSVRVRIWNDPFDENGMGYGGGNCDVASAVEIARRCQSAGLSLVVDFHYSDFWADPGKQMCPKAWVQMDLDTKCRALYAFTVDALTQIRDTGADVIMVQVGNEINGGMAGEWSLEGRNALMNAGSAAVRATLPDALVAVHFTNVNQADSQKYIREVCEGDAAVDFDVMGYSYYSYWHGTGENLVALMQDVRENFGKQVFIAETAYPFTSNNLDLHPNSVPNEWCNMKSPISRAGQAEDFRQTVQTAVQAGALGVFYWEPAWIPVPANTWEAQSALWEQYGAGWASSYAGGYDPKDAGQWYGGCAWENQALFDMDGTAAWTLRLPLLLQGNTAKK